MKPAKAHFGAGIFFALVAAILWLSGYRELKKSVEGSNNAFWTGLKWGAKTAAK